MPLFGTRDLRFHVGGPPLMENVSFMIEAGERVCLTGRNGAGKTTLLRLLLGEYKPDAGEIILNPGTRIAYLAQDIPDLKGTVAEIVAEGASHHASEGDWKVDMEAEHWVALAGLQPDMPFSSLSGGQKRRTLLARALASDPDALLLDEPTNHLDITSIDWMEDVLRSSRKALLFITHDRAFLRRMATRILELDRGKLYDWTCDWDTFLVRKEAMLDAEEKVWAEFDKKLEKEEAWARRSPKARRARNEGRVRKLEANRLERSQRRERQGTAQLRMNDSVRSSNKVIEARDLAFSYGDKRVIKSCSTIIQRGDKVAILGANGAGKTTLLRLLLGELTPDSGTVKRGDSLEILYFDQMRAQIDPEATVRQNIAGGQEFVSLGARKVHVMSYLQGFLFDPQRAIVKAGVLSGGERNRLLLARLFTRPGNVLVLDEPTNDLDMETLTLLEELLVEFDGTVLVVSHDREFLDNVATSVLAIDSNGVVDEFIGGWSDWKRQSEARAIAGAHRDAPLQSPRQQSAAKTPESVSEKRKLTFKENQEREKLPGRIEALEKEQAALIELMGTPEFYKKPPADIATAQAKQKELEKELERVFTRWEELESLAT